MRILALNSSPRGDGQSKTGIMLNAPFEIWVDIMTKKADGQQMFMEQKYTTEGDLGLLMQMDQFFGQE